MAAATVTEEERQAFAALADYLVPASGEMPAATAVGVDKELLDEVLRARPDLLEGLRRGIAACAGKPPGEALNALMKDDAEAFGAVSLAASGGYYMADAVRERLGYPGQEGAPYDPHETPDYLTNGMIERVVRRGPLYKPTPR